MEYAYTNRTCYDVQWDTRAARTNAHTLAADSVQSESNEFQ